jgi:SAM-dependent methyltransferase
MSRANSASIAGAVAIRSRKRSAEISRDFGGEINRESRSATCARRRSRRCQTPEGIAQRAKELAARSWDASSTTIRPVEGDALEINRAWWDGAAAIHGDDPIYDSDALIAGADWLGEEEQTALAASVGSVDGLDVIHVQCHIGFDTISLARRGARVTGLDFSPAALAKAQDLARRSGVEATWVQADAARIPAHLHGRFDLAYATIGAISWIEDLPAWMRAVAATLRPSGCFVLVEVHPLLTMVAEREPFSLDFPYSFDGPHRFNEPGTYADPNAELASSETVNFAHSLGETVTAAIEAGLRIDSLTEHVEASKSPRPPIVPREADGRYRLRLDGQPLPILFTLLTTKLDG